MTRGRIRTIDPRLRDASEVAEKIAAGSQLRVLAVLADKRLPGQLANVPTAKEQGFDIEWPIIRGFYVGPKVSDAEFGRSGGTARCPTRAHQSIQPERTSAR